MTEEERLRLAAHKRNQAAGSAIRLQSEAEYWLVNALEFLRHNGEGDGLVAERIEVSLEKIRKSVAVLRG